MSRFLLGLSRFVFAATLLAAPWLFSGRPLPVQAGLAIGLSAAFGFWLLSKWLDPTARTGGWTGTTTVLVIVWCGFIGLAALQLFGPLSPGLPPHHGVVARIAPDFIGPSPEAETGTQSTALTRTQLARLIWPLVAIILGAQLYSLTVYRRGFYLLLALNGVALTVFGIAQRLTWNGKLYWLFPPPHEGQNFASFWNRNHAAGYLNLCLAAALGLLFAGVRESPYEWWPPRSSDDRPTWRAALVQLLLVAIPIGVIATASRGGILSAAGAFVVLIAFAFRTRQTSIVRLLMTSVVIGSILAASLGMWQLARARFDGFSLAAATEEGRWRHWRDMVPALNDVWRSGTGLGTYRYANRPYQNHALSTTYWNADNEYLELAIEGGLPAVLLLIMGGGTLLFFLRSVCRSVWMDDEETADLGPVTAFLLIAQGLQAGTDYGISIPANALTCAAMLGALTGSRFPSVGEVAHDEAGCRWKWWAWFPFLMVIGGMTASNREFSSAATAASFLQSVPDFESAELRDRSDLFIEASIAHAEQLLARRPDDFELHRCLAELHLHRYRRELFARAQAPRRVPKPPSPEDAWMQTHPAVWDAQCRQAAHQGHTAAIDDIRTDPAFQRDVPHAYEAFLRAQQLCPFDPQTDLHLASLSYLCGNGQEDRSRWLRTALVASPGEPKWLRAIALMTEPVIEDDLAALCWRRAIELDPNLQDTIYREAGRRLSPADTLEHVVLADAPSLLRFAELVDDPLIQQMAADRLATLLNAGTGQPQGETWMQLGRLALLQGQTEAACEHFRKAVQIEPLRWEFRLRYAQALEAKGDLTEALEQTKAGLRMSPEQPELQNLQKQLISR